MITIRETGMENLDTIRQLAYEIWPGAYGELLAAEQLEYMLDKFYSISSLQNQLNGLRHQFILVYEDEAAIGFASFSTHDDSAIYHLNKSMCCLHSREKILAHKFWITLLVILKCMELHSYR